MKLSDIKGERVFDVIADIIDPIVNIAQDSDATELFAPKEEKPEDMDKWTYFLMRVKRSLPPLLKKHRDDFVTILAAVNNVTPKQYRKDLTMQKLFADIIELVTDQEFTSFFG